MDERTETPVQAGRRQLVERLRDDADQLMGNFNDGVRTDLRQAANEIEDLGKLTGGDPGPIQHESPFTEPELEEVGKFSFGRISQFPQPTRDRIEVGSEWTGEQTAILCITLVAITIVICLTILAVHLG